MTEAAPQEHQQPPPRSETIYLRKTRLIERAVTDKRLTDFETRSLTAAYAHTNSETGRLWPSSETIAEAIGGTAPAVRHALGRAVSLGYLIVIAPGGRKGGNKTTLYELPPVIPGVQVRLAPVRTEIQVTGADATTCNPARTRPVILGVHKPIEEPKKKVSTVSRPPKNEPEPYAFDGKIIRLTEADFSEWQRTYYGIADLRAELANYDLWLDEHTTGKERGKWYHRARTRMNAIHQQRVAAQKQGNGQSLNDAF